eukprot:COSAG01_NODE_10161_length_2233_cov_1.210403_2_plen_224_part_00
MVAMTRNPIAEVVRFFEERHPGRYRIYNLCIEQYGCYDPTVFATGAVLHYPCSDHNPPPLAMLHHFALSAKAWLAADPAHVAAVHCKAGKGRTGCMIVAGERNGQSAPSESPNRLAQLTKTPCAIRFPQRCSRSSRRSRCPLRWSISRRGARQPRSSSRACGKACAAGRSWRSAGATQHCCGVGAQGGWMAFWRHHGCSYTRCACCAAHARTAHRTGTCTCRY